ncbi:hypothetical protein ACH5RR_006399 [Cinchona calisaya]|uniref:Receptor ligand binding region domain-containing protein n=1 Tax=Cinchona calisaya TaxID=153742 RepID=A0ABD3AP84_9GENT
MLKNEEVHGVLGPQRSKEATFVAELGARAQAPVISFTWSKGSSRALSHSNSTYFVRTTPDDIYRVKSLAAICQGFDWQEVIVLYEDTEYGNIFFSKLYKAFQEVHIHLSYISAISTSAEDVDLTKELNKTMEMYTKVFLVHMNISLGHRLFVLARNAGMMSEGYAWLMTDSLSNFLTSVDTSPMEGVLGLRPHVPQSKNLENFTAKWKRKAFFRKPAIMELNMYGLWAYDAVWALALAIERILPLNSDLRKSRQGELNISDISNLRVSQLGRRILTELLRTKFTGLSGEFHLVDGQLLPSAFEIFNVIGTGDQTVGYWTPDRGISKNVSSIGESTYSTSTKELRAIMWSGDTLVTPKAWGIPATRTLRVGVFLNLSIAKDHESNPTNQPKGSPSEAVNESQKNTNISNTNVGAVPSPEPSTDQGEANESEPTKIDVISSGLGEIQLSESRNVETPAAATGKHIV